MHPQPEKLGEMREYPILYVDDEPENLRIFELTFRREFTIFTATSGEEGLEIINTKPVALVLSDHRMPGMTGTEFLAQVADVDPNTLRMMVTAYGDAATLQDAINNGAVYKFIAKPWQPDEVRTTLLRAIESYALAREKARILHEMTVLNRVSAILNTELNESRLLALLTRTLRDEMGFDGAGLLVKEPKTGHLIWGIPASRRDEVDERLAEMRFTPENARDFLEKLEDGRAQKFLLDDVLDYHGAVRDWVTEVAAEEIHVTPLYGKNGLTGAITIDNRRGGPKFTADDCTLVEGLCNQASIAMDNARLIDDLRRSREQVRRADRLGTLGTLAAGLAHEINNPLVSINTFLSMAPSKRQENDTEFWGDYYDLTLREVDRIRGLVDTMRRLGQGGASTMPHETVDATEIVGEVVTLLHREAELGHIDLRFAADASTPKVIAVRDQIHQVVLNLMLNALAATPAEGEILVRTSAAPSGEGLDIEVHDSGPGIPEEHLEQIFDPFFTTKGPADGTGLGLMVCHRIVTDHGGTIEVRNRETEGATFLVRLPLDASLEGRAAS